MLRDLLSGFASNGTAQPAEMRTAMVKAAPLAFIRKNWSKVMARLGEQRRKAEAEAERAERIFARASLSALEGGDSKELNQAARARQEARKRIDQIDAAQAAAAELQAEQDAADRQERTAKSWQEVARLAKQRETLAETLDALTAEYVSTYEELHAASEAMIDAAPVQISRHDDRAGWTATEGAARQALRAAGVRWACPFDPATPLAVSVTDYVKAANAAVLARNGGRDE